MLSIAVLGAECTGKTTLVQGMAGRLRAIGARVCVVDEALRDWCAVQGRTPRPHEQAAILQAQIAAVDAAPTCDYLLCDTTPLMTAVYSDVLFGDHSLYPTALAHQRRYQLSLLADTDLPWQADGIQRDGPAARARVDRRLRDILHLHDLVVQPIGGRGDARLECALAALAHLPGQLRSAQVAPAGGRR